MTQFEKMIWAANFALVFNRENDSVPSPTALKIAIEESDLVIEKVRKKIHESGRLHDPHLNIGDDMEAERRAEEAGGVCQEDDPFDGC